MMDTPGARITCTIEEPERAIRADRPPAVFQDLQSGLVVPVMDDALQHVRVRSRGNSFEEISADDFAPLAYRLLPQGGRASDYAGQIVKDATQTRIGSEDSS